MQVNINDVVMVYGQKGVVRYISSENDSIIGVELDKPLGLIGSTFNGKCLFNCKPYSAIYCRMTSIMKYTVEDAACILIQRFIRGFITRLLYLKLVAFYFMNELENYQEQRTLKNYKEVAIPFTNDIRRRLGSDVSDILDEHASPIDLNANQNFNIMDLNIPLNDTLMPDGYNGPKLGDKVTMKFALELFDCYLRGVMLELPIEYTQKILVDSIQLLDKLYTGSLIRLNVSNDEGSKLIVVGDVHGQLQDVLWIFYKLGPPSAKNVYLFNGDIADRGPYSSNIFLLLFAFKLACPESIHINRGNHESEDMNEMYGFAREVRSKYNGDIYRLFQNVFWLLPLATVIENKIIVLHGGLFRYSGVTLEDINNTNRKRTCPATPSTYDDSIMFDILWSDPRPELGIGGNSRGVDCITFGPDITNEFLKNNKLEICIRSHQVPSNLKGFEVNHSGACLTLFSASNYRGITQNSGAIFIFGPNMTFEAEEYMAPSLETIHYQSSSTHDITERILSSAKAKEIEKTSPHNPNIAQECVHDIIQKISEYVCTHKHQLWEYFYTNVKGSLITPKLWRSALESVTDIRLPWIFGTRLLKAVDENGLIDYNKILRRFVIGFYPKSNSHTNLQKECLSQVFETILRSDLSLKETLLVFDRNLDGAVSYSELDEIIRKFNFGLSNPQVKILMRTILSSCIQDGCRGHADIAEFLGKLKVIYSKSINYSPEESWMIKALPVIGRALLSDKIEAAERYYNPRDLERSINKAIYNNVDVTRRRSSAIRAVALCQKFQDFDEIESGFLSYESFVKAIMRLDFTEAEREIGFKITEEHVLKIAKMIDVSNSNKINYLEFLQAFYVVDRNKYSVADELWSHMCSCIYKHHCSLRHALHSYDYKRSGKVHTIEFKEALHSLNSILGDNNAIFTHEQIDLLVDCIDTDNEGLIDYNEFLDSFQPTYKIEENDN